MLDVSPSLAAVIALGHRVVLRDVFFNPVAVLTVRDVWTPDKAAEAAAGECGVGFLV